MGKDNRTINLSNDEFLRRQRETAHPKTKELGTLVVMLFTGILGAIIGMELIVNLGISANTSIIGALIAVLVGFVPIKTFQKFQNIHRQNLVETSISASTFTAGNVFMLSLGTIWALGDYSLLIPTIVGCIVGVLADILVMYWLFDTPAFPADGTWPVGVATSETIISVAQGGKRAFLLLIASVIGAAGQYFKIPMDIFGVCWIGDIWALSMFGIGLLISGYSEKLFGFKISSLYIPHGIMIGAGIVALIQLGFVLKNKRVSKATEEERETNCKQPLKNRDFTIGALKKGSFLFVGGALAVAILGGLYTQMSLPMLICWVLFTGLTSIVAELMIGTAAMYAGWFPAMATSLIFLILGMLLRFPTTALALLIGYKICTGPAFADMGYDLKTGWLLRGRGEDAAYEIRGRREQLNAELLGAVIGIVISILSYKQFFSNGLLPPVAKVFATTIKAGTSPDILKYLVIFAVAGGIIQAIGGAKKQIGVLFATGLLIPSPMGGIAALVSLTIRIILEKKYGDEIKNTLAISAAGFIVGSSVFNFAHGTLGMIRKNKIKQI